MHVPICLPGRPNRRLVLTVALLGVGAAQALVAVPRIDHEALCTHKTLTWADFRGPSVTKMSQSGAWIASTVVLESFEFDISPTVGGRFVAKVKYPAVYAVMDKLKSGVRRGNQNDKTLAHEQVHFDITETYARRFMVELSELQAIGDSSDLGLRRDLEYQVEVAFVATLEELFSYQDRYDRETGHGLKKRSQKSWALAVQEMLAQEPPYPLR